jgi:hypothetical protein
MRAPCFVCLVGVALACSGEPFAAAPGHSAGLADTGSGAGSVGGSSASAPIPVTAGTSSTPVSGGQAGSGQSSGGTSSTAGAPAPFAGGTSANPGGADAGGEGGAAEEPACPSRADDDWELGYFPELRDAQTQESHPFFQLTSRSATVQLSRLAIRYYFTKESDLPESGVCFWVTGDRCSLASFEFGNVSSLTPSAARYLQVTFPRATNVTITPGTFEVRVGFKTGSSPLLQTNDYSFDPNSATPSLISPYPYKRWPRTTLYVDGTLVWGTEPCASGDPASD